MVKHSFEGVVMTSHDSFKLDGVRMCFEADIEYTEDSVSVAGLKHIGHRCVGDAEGLDNNPRAANIIRNLGYWMGMLIHEVDDYDSLIMEAEDER